MLYFEAAVVRFKMNVEMSVPHKEDEPIRKNALQVAAKESKPLSKGQQQFSRLTRRIESLKIDLTQESEKLGKLLKLYEQEIVPLQEDAASLSLALAMALGKAAEHAPLTHIQTEEVGKAIVGLCDEAFNRIDPNEQHEVFYDRWSTTSYRDQLEQQLRQAKVMFADLMSDVYRTNIDIDDMEDTPDGFARFQQRMREQQEQARQGRREAARPKTRKQLAQELLLKEEEAVKSKSIRGLYISLAKIFHPDIESDATRKAEKEEIMKKVTAAYEQQDLPTLLRLEMEWVHHTSENLEQLTEDKLKVYLLVLQQQIADLEKEKIGLLHSPRYEAVTVYACMPHSIAISRIKKDRRELTDLCCTLDSYAVSFERSNAVKPIMEFVSTYNRQRTEDHQEDRWNDILI